MASLWDEDRRLKIFVGGGELEPLLLTGGGELEPLLLTGGEMKAKLEDDDIYLFRM